MSTKIKKELQFVAGVYFENKFFMTVYNIELYLNIFTDDPAEQYIGMERIKFLFDNCFSDAIFISDSHKDVINQLTKLGFKVSTLPFEPYDQAIAIALIHKINAIVEDRYLLTDIIFGSTLSEGIKYLIDYEDDAGPFSIKNNWWHDSGMGISNIKKTKISDKIVKLNKVNNEWGEVGLNWKNNIPSNKAEIVFTIEPEKN